MTTSLQLTTCTRVFMAKQLALGGPLQLWARPDPTTTSTRLPSSLQSPAGCAPRAAC